MEKMMDRRRMRKGTFSCTECRRRRIRCVFVPPNQDCRACQARGSVCIDQRDLAAANGTGPGSQEGPAASTSTSRQLSHGQQRQPFQEAPLADFNIAPVHSSRLPSNNRRHDAVLDPPLISAMRTAGACARSSPGGEGGNGERPPPPPGGGRAAVAPAAAAVARAADLCRTLRSIMPTYDEILAALPTAGGGACWWRSFRLKMQTLAPPHAQQAGSGESADPLEPLEGFAARAYTGIAGPAVLGTLAAAYARSLQSGSSSSSSSNRVTNAAKIYGEVERLVLSDMAYAATSEGLECLVLLAYCYMDSGMPRRAWYLWRKGLGIAQLMGLHQLSATSPAPPHLHTRLWHAVYHGDLFASLVLGLPRGFRNPYHDLDLALPPPSPSGKAPGDGGGAWLEHFICKCALLAGKVIDRNAFWLAGGGKQPASTDIMEDSLSRALRELKELPPDGWWHVPAPLPAGPGLALDSAVATLLLQVFYFHTAMYIHLPALAAADPVSSAECAAAASNLLQRYLPLREGPSPAFESMTSDFVAFTAAVVLALYTSLSTATTTTTNNQHSAPAARVQEDDGFRREGMMAGALTMFRRLEREAVDREDGEEELHNNRLPGKCRKILELLYGGRQPAQAQEIRIPYFGKVLLGPVAASGPSATEQQQPDGSRQPSSSTTAPPCWDAWLEEADQTPSSSGPSGSMLHAPPSMGPPAADHHHHHHHQQQQQQGHDNITFPFWGSDGGPTMLEFTPEFGGRGEGHFDIFSAGDLPLSSDAVLLDIGQHDWGMRRG